MPRGIARPTAEEACALRVHREARTRHSCCYRILEIMAKFLNASATAYHLEQLIKEARTRLILISPELKFSGRTKELLEEKSGIEAAIVYGQNDLPPEEVNWLRGLASVRTSFCRNLRAKCYLNEEFCIVTSLSLYDFSQVANHEMGVLIVRAEDEELYRDAREEAERIIRSSDEVRISVDKVERVAGAPGRTTGRSTAGEGEHLPAGKEARFEDPGVT